MKKENERNKEDDENKYDVSNTCFEFIKNTFSIPIMKDKTFWITVVVFFFFSFGTSLPTFSLPALSSELQEQLAPPVDSFYEALSSNIGKLVGLILTYALMSLTCVKSYRERRHKMGFVFSTITLSGYIMAILSIITSDDYIYYIAYIFVLTIFEVLTDNFRDDSMPSAFGRFTIRLTQGFLHTSIGLAGVTAAGYHNGIDKAKADEGWKLNFRLGGGFFLLSGSITGITLIINIISKRNSCLVNKSSDGTSTKLNTEDAKERKCCLFVCCMSSLRRSETKLKKSDPKCCSFTSTCFGKKRKLSQTDTDADNSESAIIINRCNCLLPSCLQKKQPTSETQPDIEKDEANESISCCKEFQSSCFQRKPSSSEIQAETDKNESTFTFNFCKDFSLSCFQKKQSMIQAQPEINKDEANENINCCKRFPPSWFQRKRPRPEIKAETDKSESTSDNNCFNGFSPSCFQKERPNQKNETHNNDIERLTPDMQNEYDESSCNCFVNSKTERNEINQFSEDKSLNSSSEKQDPNAIDSARSVKQQVFDIFSCKCFYPTSRPTTSNKEPPTSRQSETVGPSCFPTERPNQKNETHNNDIERLTPDMQNEYDESSCKCFVHSKTERNEINQFSEDKSLKSSSEKQGPNAIDSARSVKQQVFDIFSCKCFNPTSRPTTSNKEPPTSRQSETVVPSCFPTERPNQENETHNNEIETLNPDMQNEYDESSCKCFVHSKTERKEIKQFSEDNSVYSLSENQDPNAINSARSVKQQVFDIFSCKCCYPTSRPTTSNKISPTSRQSETVGPSPYQNTSQENFIKPDVDTDKVQQMPPKTPSLENSTEIERKPIDDEEQDGNSTQNESNDEELPSERKPSQEDVEKIEDSMTESPEEDIPEIKSNTDLDSNNKSQPNDFIAEPLKLDTEKENQPDKDLPSPSPPNIENDTLSKKSPEDAVNDRDVLEKKIQNRRNKSEASDSAVEANQIKNVERQKRHVEKIEDSTTETPEDDVSEIKSITHLDSPLKLDTEKENQPDKDLPSPSPPNIENDTLSKKSPEDAVNDKNVLEKKIQNRQNKSEASDSAVEANQIKDVEREKRHVEKIKDSTTETPEEDVSEIKSITDLDSPLKLDTEKENQPDKDIPSPSPPNIEIDNLSKKSPEYLVNDRNVLQKTKQIGRNKSEASDSEDPNQIKNVEGEKRSEPQKTPKKGLENVNNRTPKRNKNDRIPKKKHLFELSDSEEEAMECRKYERALAPPTKPSYRNRGLRYEANRIKRAQREESSEPTQT